MNITNNTDVELYINGVFLKPGKMHTHDERIFDVLNIHSDIGSGVIISEYSERFIRTFGNLKIKEENKNIIIFTET